MKRFHDQGFEESKPSDADLLEQQGEEGTGV